MDDRADHVAQNAGHADQLDEQRERASDGVVRAQDRGHDAHDAVHIRHANVQPATAQRHRMVAPGKQHEHNE